MRRSLLAAGCGLLAAVAGLAAGSAVAALLSGAASPVVSVGNVVIDATPGALKDWAVETFGEYDKLVLIGSVLVVVLLIAAVTGVVGLYRRRVALGLAAVLGLVAVGAAAIDRTLLADWWIAIVPGLVTTVVVVVSLAWLLATIDGLGTAVRDGAHEGIDRRRFLVAALATSAVTVGGGVVARLSSGLEAAASRMRVRVPQPSRPAPPVPSGAIVDLDGVTPYLTPNAEFYRVDTALQVPDVPAESWQLRVHGMVDEELTMSYAELLERRLMERRITLTCVSNQVGGGLAGNATWIGVPLRDLLAEVRADPAADAVLSTSADDMTIGTPLETLTDDRGAMLAVAMNGEPLPLEHGFPVRMVVPGLYGFVSATKWVVDLEVTRFADISAYWTERDWSEEAPIKTASRIDVPRSFQTLPVDAVRVGGVAWAQTRGIERVEVRVDDGPWNEVELAALDNVDTWRQWSWSWRDATRGTHEVTVRATDATGYTQTSERAEPRPDGATGWHSVQFTVE